MKTGFFDLGVLKEQELKQFFLDAIMLSYDTHIDIMGDRWRRERYENSSINEMMEILSKETHNVCIDRSIQHKESKYGEIGFSTMKRDKDLFLYIFLTLDNLYKLIHKYRLKERYE